MNFKHEIIVEDSNTFPSTSMCHHHIITYNFMYFRTFLKPKLMHLMKATLSKPNPTDRYWSHTVICLLKHEYISVTLLCREQQ